MATKAVFEGRGRRGISRSSLKGSIPEGLREAIVYNANTPDGAEQVRRLEQDGYEFLNSTVASADLPEHAKVMVIDEEIWVDNKRMAEQEARDRVHARVDLVAEGVYDQHIRITQDTLSEGQPLKLSELGSSLQNRQNKEKK